MRLLVHWLIVAFALLAATWLVPGIRIEDTRATVAVIVMAAILGLVNALVRPVVRLVASSLIVLTLGLFLLVINAAMLGLASWITVNWFGIGFYLDGFWPAVWGSIVVSIVSFLLALVFVDRPVGRK